MSLLNSLDKVATTVMPYMRALRRAARPAPAPAPQAKPPLPGLNVRFDIVDTANKRWGQSERGHRITVPRNPILGRSTKIFTMGSCFALEIRAALEQRGFEVFPKYQQIALNPGTQRLEDDATHYDTFTIRQEFEQALAGKHFGIEDFLSHTHKLSNKFETGGRTSWQDPYRKRVFAADEASILDVSRKLDDCVAEGIREADVYIITLGLIETWRNTRNGFHICLPPYDDRRGGMDKFDHIQFHHSNYAESYENLKRVCSLIQEKYPSRKIVLTVSPVGLGRTYTGDDVVVATIEAKSILRAATSQICREFSNVTYWPSYELCTKDDIFREDGRHVRRDAVAMIVDAFTEAHVDSTR
jgi:hypothetical protein